MSVRQSSRKPANAREQIDWAAYELFSQYGVRAVGVDALAARAGVAKRTLYKYYPSKIELVLAFLRRREEMWTRSWLQRGIERAAVTPARKLLAIFDVFDEWFRRPDFEACSFIRVLLEHAESGHPLRKASQRHIHTLRLFITASTLDQELASDAKFHRATGLV
jgi:AcrR family transcriptional regulator